MPPKPKEDKVILVNEQPKHKYQVALNRVLKKVKALEKLKLLKKLGGLKEDSEEVEKKDDIENIKREESISQIEVELELIRSLDLELLTKRLLQKIIKKTKTLNSHEAFQAYLKETFNWNIPDFEDEIEVNVFKNSIEKVENRMSSNIQTSKCLEEIKFDLLKDIGLENEIKKLKGTKFKRKNNDTSENKDRKVPDTNQEKELDKTIKDTEITEIKDSKSRSTIKKASTKKKEQPLSNLYVDKLGDYDEEDEEFNKMYGKTKRNRMGQRQRRMLYEQKYGSEANHLKRARQVEASVAKFEKSKRRNNIKPNSNRSNEQGQGGDKNNKNKKKKEEALHPSWEAKRQQKLAIANSAPKGKKIVFD